MSNQKFPKEYYKLSNGEEIAFHKINNDINGNPYVVVHFLELGIKLEDYGRIPKLTKYRAKWFGGGIKFQCFNFEEDFNWHREQVKKFYEKKGE